MTFQGRKEEIELTMSDMLEPTGSAPAKNSARTTVAWWLGAITAVVFFVAGVVVGRFVLPTTLAPTTASSLGAGSSPDLEALAAVVRKEVQTALKEVQPTLVAQAQQTQPQQQSQQQRQRPQQPQVVSNVSEDDDPALGPKDAKVVVVEFSDFQ